jgi:hypothetical protein
MLMRGRTDRDYQSDQLETVANQTSSWSYTAQRWVGDLNGDGHADMISAFNDYIDYREDGEIAPYPYYGDVLEVRYGTEDGLPNTPDHYLNYGSPDIPENSWISIQYGGVGDVNGDGFNDVFVYRQGIYIYNDPPPGEPGGRGDDTDPDEPPRPDPDPEPKETYLPPDFQLFYGSEDGLPTNYSWNGTPVLSERYFYLQAVDHGDVNGDGYSDIILSSTTAPHVSVYHGSEDGISLEPDTTITFNTQYAYGWTLHAPVDLDGDEYDDVVVDFGDTEGLTDYVQYIYPLRGSEGGLPGRITTNFKLSSHENAKVVMTDINGDGLDDVFISQLEQLMSENKVAVRMQVHFNSGEGFPLDPSWQHRIASMDGQSYSGNSDGGDFDGDGYGDAVLGVPGTTIWRSDGTYENLDGHIIIVNGGGIMDLLRPLSLREGPVLYAGYKAYDFRVNGNPTGLSVLPDQIRLTLDPGGADVVLEAGLSPGGSYIEEDSDPEGLVTLTSDLMDIVHDTLNNTIWVHFRVMFDWDWPHEDLSNVLIQSRVQGQVTPYTARDVFYVENDLDLIGNVSAVGEFQGELEELDWVRAGESVTVSGPVVVYEGTTDVYPPDGVCDVVLMDNADRFSKTDLVSGEVVSISLDVETATDTEENLTLTLQDLPGLATLVSRPQFRLRVDGDLPAFTHIVPDPDDWHSSSQVLASATADDSATSGVKAATMEYAYSTDDGATYSEWSRVDLETTGDGPTVDGLVALTIPDGEDNFIRWRVWDLVGNGPAVSADHRIRVDTINVTYTDAFPDPGVWQTVLAVECGVTIQDMDGAGIEAASIQYRVSNQNLSGYGEWMVWTGSSTDAEVISVSQTVDMGNTPFNYVQWRAKDIAGNGYTTSPHYRVKVDTLPIQFSDFAPTDGPFDHSVIMVLLNVSDGDLGSGVDMGSIEYRVQDSTGAWSDWEWAGMEGARPRDRFGKDLTLADGTNLVQFRGWDVAGNGPGASDTYTLVVDTTGPGFGVVSPGPEEKQAEAEVTVGITITDAVVGLDSSTVEYQFATDGDLRDEWHTAPATSNGEGGFTVLVSITLSPGEDNLVQFRASDLLGNTAVSDAASIWVNRAPTATIRSPVAEESYVDRDMVVLNATGSSDPDGDALNYTWYMEGSDVPLGWGRVLETTLVAGEYNVTLVVRDDVGAEGTTSVRVSVDEYVPPDNQTSSTSWWLLLVLLAVVVVGVAFYYKRRQDSLMEEWEEIE